MPRYRGAFSYAFALSGRLREERSAANSTDPPGGASRREPGGGCVVLAVFGAT